jgi:UDP-MurNAc hydroxylase
MKITSIGHAGFLIETNGLRILCDPWFYPQFFASWFPFPRNDYIDKKQIGEVTHLYVSHPHKDHFDSKFLKQYVSKDATVIMPVYPLPFHEEAMRKLGFSKFVYCRDGEVVSIGNNVNVTAHGYTAPTDGGVGDSCLLIDDGEVRVLHLNDAHPEDATVHLKNGPIDLLMLQYSGASWYPVVYDFPKEEKLPLYELKRNNQTQRALRYAEQLAPKYIIPCAGPACFLDDELFHLNDFDNDPYSVFPDQKYFLNVLESNHISGGHLMIAGSTGILEAGQFKVSHQLSDNEINEIYNNKKAYLKSYQESWRQEIENIRNSWGDSSINLVSTLQEWWVPLLRRANKICAGVDGIIVFDVGDEKIMVDFVKRKVLSWNGEPWKYCFTVDRKIFETCLKERFENWPADLFLSLRMKIQRQGKYDECVYGFLRCLSMERIEYFEKHYREYTGMEEMCSMNGHRFERFCPHMKVDLESYGSIEGDILTCRRHGWQFNLVTGECLTSKNYSLRIESQIDNQKDG